MPELAILGDGTMLASELHIPVNNVEIAHRVGSLLAGTLYRASAKDNSGDWGNTALAMSILNLLHVQPPASVTSRVRTELPTALATRQASQLFTVASVLSLMTAKQVRDNRSQVRAQLDWIESQLQQTASLTKLALGSEVRPVIRRAGLPPWPIASVCNGLQTSTGGVVPVGSAQVDPQATFQAIELGCKVPSVPPPWTAAGWPTDVAVSNNIIDSIDGLRIARFLGTSAQYASQMRAQLSQVWLPDFSADRANGDIAGLVELSRLLSVRSPELTPTLGEVSGAIAAQGTGGLLDLLAAYLLDIKDSRFNSSDGQSSAQGNIFTAAAENLKFLVTGDRRFLAMARKIVNGLSSGNGLYTVAVRSGNTQPSAVATAIADWILHLQVPSATLRVAGLCNTVMSCGELGASSAIDEPLRATAAVMIMNNADSNAFPIGI